MNKNRSASQVQIIVKKLTCISFLLLSLLLNPAYPLTALHEIRCFVVSRLFLSAENRFVYEIRCFVFCKLVHSVDFKQISVFSFLITSNMRWELIEILIGLSVIGLPFLCLRWMMQLTCILGLSNVCASAGALFFAVDNVARNSEGEPLPLR